MNTVKTAVSLDQELFTRAEELAQVLHLSRSELYSRALRTYLQHQENQVLLHRLNVAYGPGEGDEDNQRLGAGMRRAYTRVARGEQ